MTWREMNPWALPQQGDWQCSLGLPWRPLARLASCLPAGLLGMRRLRWRTSSLQMVSVKTTCPGGTEKRARVLVQLGVEHGCQVRWLLGKLAGQACFPGAREGPRSSALCHPLTSTRQAAVPDYCYLQGLCSVLGMVQSVSLLSNGHTAPGGGVLSTFYNRGAQKSSRERAKSSNRRIGDRDLPGSV